MELGFQQLSNFLLVVIVVSFYRTSQASLNRNLLGVSFGNFEKDESSHLNITSIASQLIKDAIDCGFACLENSSCFSYNLAAFPDVNRTELLCELLPSDKYNNSDKFNASKKFHHFSIPSPCSSWPCQNNGTCISNYAKKSYACHCIKGFTGKHCQTNINECESSPCLNNGTCTDLVNGFNCSCPQAFKGDRCEKGPFSVLSAIIAANASYESHLHQFLTPAVGSNPQWLLCHRASTHGWAASTFHRGCDGKNHTVTIIKKGQYVFGGYTDIPWESSGGYTYTSNSFIFSLRNKEGLSPFKSMVNNPSYAITRSSGQGPTFGGGWDINIADNADSNNNSHANFGYSYLAPSGVQDRRTILAGTRYFTPDDWEVFYLG